MATAGEEDVEYESDPEEVKRSLVMRRRRAASDDEDSEEDRTADREKEGPDLVTRIHSDESDGQGAAADYEDEEDEEYLEEDEEEEAYNEEHELIDDLEVRGQDLGNDKGQGRVNEEREGAVEGASEVAVEVYGDAPVDGQITQDGEKKPNEPYAVPTAGAFYMHDDRFRDNAGGRHRRTFGGRKLWESRDERKWGHDKFEELSMQERHYDERRRNLRGHARGRGRNRGLDRGYGRGNRSKTFDNNTSTGAATINNNNSNNNQAPAPRAVRGRGPRRHDHSLRKNNQGPPSQSKPSTRSDNPQFHNPGQTVATSSNAESDSAPARRNAFGSSLNSASPPFYPSGSSNKEGGLPQKKDVQTGNSNRNSRPSAMNDNFSVPEPNHLLRGKNVANSVGMDKLSVDDLVTAFSGKSFSPMQAASGAPSISSQASQARAQGRGSAPAAGQKAHQSAFYQGQTNRGPPSLEALPSQRSEVSNRGQLSAQQLGQHPGSVSQASSPPKTAASVNSYESGDAETPSELSKSKGALVTKGKGNSIQGSGRGTFIYGGAHVMGAGGPMGVGRGDQNFPGTPAFLPVMQFGGQHPGGIGVPAVGMAFPGYVAQPQLGLGNSEMTWLPVLAGAAGALGATYCPPYLAVDGSYHSPPSGQTSAAGSTSKESNKPNNDTEPPQGTESVNEEQGQRQNKARRYSEMNFGQ